MARQEVLEHHALLRIATRPCDGPSRCVWAFPCAACIARAALDGAMANGPEKERKKDDEDLRTQPV